MTEIRPVSLDQASPALPAPLSAAFLDDLSSGASRRDAERDLPFAIIDQMKALRFGAHRLPTAQGGSGAPISAGIAAAIDLGAADPNVAHIWRNHHMLLERLVIPPTTHPGLLRLREAVAQGALIGLAATEPQRSQTGSIAVFDTKVRRSGAGYVLNGRKFYCTGSIFADWISVAASTEDGALVTVILPRTRAGVETVDDWDGMGQRLTGTGTTLFHDVALEPEEVIAKDTIPALPGVLSSVVAQLFLTAVIAGITASVAREAEALLRSRKQPFYFSPTERAQDDPLLLAGLGDRQADAFATRAVVLHAAAALDLAADAIARGAPDAAARVEEAAAAAAKAKITVDRIAQSAATALFEIGAASSTQKPRNLDRHWRNIRTISSHNPSSLKAYALGNLAINAAPLPSQGFF